MRTLLNHLRTQALRWLYALLSSCAAFVFAPRLILLLCGAKEHRKRIGERWGWHDSAFKERLGRNRGRRVWIHAVSVGEVDVALSLIEVLHKEDPGMEFVLTMVTCEGRQLAERSARRNMHVSYAPFDLAGAVRRCFQTFDADVLVLVELEIWPNQLWEAVRQRVPVAVINGRLPERDLAKYRRVRWFMRDTFDLLTLVCVQTSTDAKAFFEMGVKRTRIQITGSMKMDAALQKSERPLGDESIGSRGIWEAIAQRTLVVGGSTHPGEEEILFSMVARMKAEFAGFLMVVAPRDTSRAESVVRAACHNGLTTLTWSQVLAQSDPPLHECNVLVVDTIGDLERFYRLARVVFVGKSLTARGGQNPMEPAAAGRPVLFGPFMENFRAVVDCFLESRAAIQVANARELETEILRLLRDPGAADALGRAGREVVQTHTGATQQTVLLLCGLMQRAALQNVEHTEA